MTKKNSDPNLPKYCNYFPFLKQSKYAFRISNQFHCYHKGFADRRSCIEYSKQFLLDTKNLSLADKIAYGKKLQEKEKNEGIKKVYWYECKGSLGLYAYTEGHTLYKDCYNNFTDEAKKLFHLQTATVPIDRPS